MAGYDLHTHTTFSDGTTSPAENVALACELGLRGLAVTDHDTTAGWEAARAAADGTDLEIVPGAEISAEHEGYSVHVLGYWFDPEHRELAGELERIRGERDRRAVETVERFGQLGIAISMDRVRELAGPAPIGRPHIAAAVVETGAADDVSEVFDRWLHDGGPAYVAKYAVDPVRCVELIRSARGVAVLAHPGLYGPPGAGGIPEEVVERVIEAGLAGIEADHPDHDEDQRTRYRDLAAANRLVVSGGSDYHGDRKDLRLGEVTTAADEVWRLRERLPR